MSNRRNNRSFYAHDDRDADGPELKLSSNRGGAHWRGGRGRGSRGFRGNNRSTNVFAERGPRQERFQTIYVRGRGSSRLNRYSQYNPRNSIRHGWRRITVTRFGTASMDEVITTLKSHVESDFTPIKVHLALPGVIHFYLDRDPAAEGALLALSNRISVGDGPRLTIKSDIQIPRATVLDSDMKSLVERVMSKRFSPESNSLNMSNFHRDSELIAANIYCPVEGCPETTKFLFDTMLKNIPNVQEINFTNNKLETLKGFQALRQFPNLKKLNFFMNKIQLTVVLENLKNLPITELNMGQKNHKKPRPHVIR